MKRIFDFFRRLFSRDTAEKIQKGIEVAAPYFKFALEVTETIAALTPTRADDEILAAIRHYGLPLALGDNENRATVLRDIALQVLRREFPGAPDRQLNRAIEVALGAVRP